MAGAFLWGLFAVSIDTTFFEGSLLDVLVYVCVVKTRPWLAMGKVGRVGKESF